MTEVEVQPAILEEIYYPETDGEPMAESDFQRNPLIYAVKALDIYFAKQPDVYVSGNLLLYYVEGNPKKAVAPDVFVVFGVPKHLRPIYKVWEEGKGPDVVIEITSKTTRKRDEEDKPTIYRDMGVQEYFQYDPTGDYLMPALRGRRLDASGEYHLIPPMSRNGGSGVLVLPSRVLDLELHLDQGRLRLFEPLSKSYLFSHEEEREARQQAEEARQQEAEARRHAEEVRRQAEEVRRQWEEKFNMEAEARRQEAEARRQEAEARRQAEERIKALEAEMQRMRQRTS
jgi:Uma2 family endonuclease